MVTLWCVQLLWSWYCSILYRVHLCVSVFFFFKQKTAYEMRISDWSSDVCSSDLTALRQAQCERSLVRFKTRSQMTLRMPAEWGPNGAVWIGFPHLAEEWSCAIDEGRRDVAAFANAVHDGGRGEEVRLVVNDARQADIAAALVDPGVKILVQPLGDIWLRDTGPIIAGTGAARRARNFLFNWWGEKFVMPGDREVGAALAAGSGLPVDDQDWILEGGGIDVDGAGLCVTTEECLLNLNRNPTLTREDIAVRLHQSPGIVRLL